MVVCYLMSVRQLSLSSFWKTGFDNYTGDLHNCLVTIALSDCIEILTMYTGLGEQNLERMVLRYVPKYFSLLIKLGSTDLQKKMKKPAQLRHLINLGVSRCFIFLAISYTIQISCFDNEGFYAEFNRASISHFFLGIRVICWHLCLLFIEQSNLWRIDYVRNLNMHLIKSHRGSQIYVAGSRQGIKMINWFGVYKNQAWHA